jgi:plastocyanin
MDNGCVITARPPRLLSAALSALTVTVVLSACGSGGGIAAPSSTPTAEPSAAPTIGVIPTVNPIPFSDGLAPTPATATIRMYTDAPFDPRVLTVAPATIIKVINESTGSQDICNLSAPGHGINTNDISPGASASFIAPDTPGTYDYSCSYYPETMKGTLIVSKDVTAPTSATPTPTPTASPSDSATPEPDTTGGSDNTGPTPSSTYNPGPGTPGYLANPEKCTGETFWKKHHNACPAYGYPEPDSSSGNQ